MEIAVKRVNSFVFLMLTTISFFTAQASEEQIRCETEQKLAIAAAREAQEVQTAESIDSQDSNAHQQSLLINSVQDQKKAKESKEINDNERMQKDLQDAYEIMYQLQPMYTSLYNGKGLPQVLHKLVFDYLQEMQLKFSVSEDVQSNKEFSPLSSLITHSNADGSYIIVGDHNGDVTLLNADSGMVIRKYATGNYICSLAVHSSHGSWHIVCGSANGTIHILDAHSGIIIKKIEIDTASEIREIVVHHKSESEWYIIALIEADDVCIWQAVSGQLIRRLTHPEPTYDFALQNFSDGSWAVITASEREIGVWDGQTGDPLRTIGVNGELAQTIASYVDKNGRWFIISAVDGDQDNILMHNGSTGDLIGNLKCDVSQVTHLLTHTQKDGQWYIISASDDKVLTIWDTRTGKEIGSFEKGVFNQCIVSFVDTDGTWCLAAGHNNAIRIWDVLRNKKIQTLEMFDEIPQSIVEKLSAFRDAQNNVHLISIFGGRALNRWSYGKGQFESEKLLDEKRNERALTQQPETQSQENIPDHNEFNRSALQCVNSSSCNL